MKDFSLPSFYLGLLVLLLLIAAVLLFRQVIKTRRTESTFSRLQNKLTKQRGTAQEYYELGSIYLDKKLYSQSITLLKKALKSKDLEGAENIALIHNALGYAYACQEQYDSAIRQYKEALEQTPEYVVALNNLGFAYEKKQLITQAVEAYEKAFAIDPKDSTAQRRAESLRKRIAAPANSER
ncbi:MAG: tetratricopeptide repeat protein [Cyanobacteria bacterium P01_E01_bin.6]